MNVKKTRVKNPIQNVNMFILQQLSTKNHSNFAPFMIFIYLFIAPKSWSFTLFLLILFLALPLYSSAISPCFYYLLSPFFDFVLFFKNFSSVNPSLRQFPFPFLFFFYLPCFYFSICFLLLFSLSFLFSFLFLFLQFLLRYIFIFIFFLLFFFHFISPIPSSLILISFLHQVSYFLRSSNFMTTKRCINLQILYISSHNLPKDYLLQQMKLRLVRDWFLQNESLFVFTGYGEHIYPIVPTKSIYNAVEGFRPLLVTKPGLRHFYEIDNCRVIRYGVDSGSLCTFNIYSVEVHVIDIVVCRVNTFYSLY